MAQKKKTPRKAARKAIAKRPAVKKPARKKAAKKKAAPKKKPSTRPSSRRRSKAAAAPDLSQDPVAQIQRVIDVMVQAGAVEVELEDAGTKLRVRLKADVPMSVVPYPAAAAATVVAAPGADLVAERASAPAAVDDPRRTVFKSPMVGTFYRATAPDADPYVEVGHQVGPDTTLCILEAMKVMNEIKAEMSGEVVEILAQNGEPVEFGQPLFVIKAD